MPKVEIVIQIISAISISLAAGAALWSVRQVEETRKDEYLPIIKFWGRVYRPSQDVSTEDLSGNIHLRNIGKGPAMELKVHTLGKVRLRDLIVGTASEDDSVSIDFQYQRRDLTSDQFPIEAEYKDIYGRKFISEAMFVWGGQIFEIDKNSWRFSRKYKRRNSWVKYTDA